MNVESVENQNPLDCTESLLNNDNQNGGGTRLLDNLMISSPCPVSWESMRGDDRQRFCNLCKLNVYNISDMSSQEAEIFLAEKQHDGRTCVTFFVRQDGTVLTDDCKGALRFIKKTARRIGSTVAALVSLFVWLAPARSQTMDKFELSIAKTISEPTFENAQKYYAEGKYNDALQEFIMLNARRPSSINHYYIALCYQNLNQRSAAARYYQLAANSATDEALRQNAQLGLRQLQVAESLDQHRNQQPTQSYPRHLGQLPRDYFGQPNGR